MTQAKPADSATSAQVFWGIWKWVFVGLGIWGCYNLGSVLLTGHLWVHSGNRATAQWHLHNATASPEGFLWGLFQTLACLLLGGLGGYWLYRERGLAE